MVKFLFLATIFSTFFLSVFAQDECITLDPTGNPGEYSCQYYAGNATLQSFSSSSCGSSGYVTISSYANGYYYIVGKFTCMKTYGKYVNGSYISSITFRTPSAAECLTEVINKFNIKVNSLAKALFIKSENVSNKIREITVFNEAGYIQRVKKEMNKINYRLELKNLEHGAYYVIIRDNHGEEERQKISI